MKQTILSLEGVDYAYEEGAFSLSGLSVAFRTGERVAVLGSNGAGKSTFFLICNGVLKPDSGVISCCGDRLDLRRKADLLKLRQTVGIVFQDPNQQLIAPTVEAEISFGPMNLRLPRPQVAQRVERALGTMRLEPFRERPPHMLSGGEKKRVTIASVLAMEPELLLFDEPTASLDPAGTDRFEQTLGVLSDAGKALVVSTHDIDFAWRWAQRLLVFHAGRLIADSCPEAVFSDAALLEHAGLRKPYLYEVSACLHKAGLLPDGIWCRQASQLAGYFPAR